MKERMIAEYQIIQYINENVLVTLFNGSNYKGKLVEFSDSTLRILDVDNVTISIDQRQVEGIISLKKRSEDR